jgi:hypothetical protein
MTFKVQIWQEDETLMGKTKHIECENFVEMLDKVDDITAGWVDVYDTVFEDRNMIRGRVPIWEGKKFKEWRLGIVTITQE